MNNLKNSILNPVSRWMVLMILVAGTACESDSLFSDKIQISETRPPPAKVGEAFSFRITAEVKNNSNDEGFDYQFSVIDGSIPPGTEFQTSNNIGDRSAEISGTPSQAGEFTFAVSVRSERLANAADNEFNNDEDFPQSTGIEFTDEEMYTIVVTE